MLPDPDFYAQCLQESIDEYKALAAALEAKAKPAKKTRKKAASKRPKKPQSDHPTLQ